jgi:hypothetical protein
VKTQKFASYNWVYFTLLLENTYEGRKKFIFLEALLKKHLVNQLCYSCDSAPMSSQRTYCPSTHLQRTPDIMKNHTVPITQDPSLIIPPQHSLTVKIPFS